jgi:small subunit ribosomal protein S16
MAVVIRLKRTGRSLRPCYRISVTDSRAPRDGRTLETLGVYDPCAPREELRLTLDVERSKHWVSVGAKPSDTVNSIFRRQGVYVDRKPKAVCKRPKRSTVTKTKAHRIAAKAARAEAKAARRDVRISAKKAALATADAE